MFNENIKKKTHCWNLGKAKYLKKNPHHKGLKYFNDTLIPPYDDKTQTKGTKNYFDLIDVNLRNWE